MATLPTAVASHIKSYSSITPYRTPIHFTFTGIRNINSTCTSGNVAANARKMDILM